MFSFRIKELMAERGFKRGKIKMLVSLGISHKVAQNYLNGSRKKIDRAHIEIFLYFFHCHVHDLFEWVPDNKLLFDEQHPIHQYKAKPKFDLLKAISKMTPEELKKRLEG